MDVADCPERSQCSIGEEVVTLVLNRLRWQANNCTDLQGFIIYKAAMGPSSNGQISCYKHEEDICNYEKTGDCAEGILEYKSD